ncbi:MAG: tRNA (N6-isopentenyl adenosine(37)-C2)-methylthiotransferase MiaB [Acidobacteria bacterium]|nr:tRNA (N6-isopentenyl adenosine(37)-C2)-methylthiotransferase MiaB [Acidobacteriota bacterium]MBI3656736.1 tRNA (N6-isopentenyl adenosine(37)-C2)-methylthiotransferase MiaB [Acidobacteriota bacterium]
MNKKKGFFIETFGCQMNDLDSRKISGLLVDQGMTPAVSMDEADIILLNTCAIRDKAIQKVYSRLGELKKRKAKNTGLFVGVIGCGAQLEGADFANKTGVVDLITGPQKISHIPRMLDRVLTERVPLIDIEDEPSPQPAEVENILRDSSFRAGVTIMEGCDQSCSFCIVPFTRGRAKHRAGERILAEVKKLAESGYIEILLLGQNVNSYQDPSPAGLSFAQLLRAVGEVPGIRRVRFTSPHPMYFTHDIIDAINQRPTLCNHVHLPLQSGSSAVLERMNREYTREIYLEKAIALRASPRRIALSTDIIVGFPGETEKDFAETLAMMDEIRFDSIFSFKYSARPRTAAAEFADTVDEAEKARRLRVLQEKQELLQEANHALYVGQVVEVLVESPARTRFALSGRTTDNRIVNFDGPNYLIGSLVSVKITQARANSLQGELVAASELELAAGS